jgi:hypothetical protein
VARIGHTKNANRILQVIPLRIQPSSKTSEYRRILITRKQTAKMSSG